MTSLRANGALVTDVCAAAPRAFVNAYNADARHYR